MATPLTVLIIGGGGREHAIAASLTASKFVDLILVTPGNAGTSLLKKARNIDVDIKDHRAVLQICKELNVNLVVVGPEEPLAAGIVDYLEAEGEKVFGPKKFPAQIESNKAWAKDFMKKNEIPTGEYETFTDYAAAKEFIDSSSWKGFAIKASGLIGGKGVCVVNSKDEAKEILEEYKLNDSEKFKEAAKTIVIEEMLTGYEVSVLAFTDGEIIEMMPPCQDHKRRYEGDLGPNTGGMGAICPCPLVSAQEREFIKENIIKKTVDKFREEGHPYIGVLYAGIMMTSDGPKVLEFNCRFGDPEIQALLLILETDLYMVMQACVDGELKDKAVVFNENLFAASLSVVIGNYPRDVTQGLGFEIHGVDEAMDDANIVVFMAGAAAVEPNSLSCVTSGGRVLNVCSTARSLAEVISNVLNAAPIINFNDAPVGYRSSFRGDIGFKTLTTLAKKRYSKFTYKSSGVDIEKGESLVRRISSYTLFSKTPKAVGPIGMFGAVFDLGLTSYKNPLLVSGTDGVGTKLKIAIECGIHDTIGQDLVAMCVNDIIVHGAEPLFFLDYIAIEKLDIDLTTKIIKGILRGCTYAECALVGGETAEMPGLYRRGDYDVAGFCVGAVEKPHLLPKKEEMKAGDVLIGIASSGIHSNGFSVIRKLVERFDLKYSEPAPYCSFHTLGELLLEPTIIYTPFLELLRSGHVLGAAHITGGGIEVNLTRVIPSKLAAKIDDIWPIPIVFSWLSGLGIKTEELLRTFNLGVGFALVVKSGSENEVLRIIKEVVEGIRLDYASLDNTTRYTDNEIRETRPLAAWVIGSLVERADASAPKFIIEGLEEALTTNAAVLSATYRKCFNFKKKRVAVLLSGRGTNMQALIDHTLSAPSEVEIGLVISNVAGAQGLKRAAEVDIPTKVILHGNRSRDDFEKEIHETLVQYDIEIVCLAGFMRILTLDFVKLWRGKLLNIHPALLPSFKGIRAQRQALRAGVTVTGCTVHFVEEEVDGGAIITQECVPVFPEDDEDTLSERIREAEHVAYPRALELVARGKVRLNEEGRIIRT